MIAIGTVVVLAIALALRERYWRKRIANLRWEFNVMYDKEKAEAEALRRELLSVATIRDRGGAAISQAQQSLNAQSFAISTMKRENYGMQRLLAAVFERYPVPPADVERITKIAQDDYSGSKTDPAMNAAKEHLSTAMSALKAADTEAERHAALNGAAKEH